jgi:hypothetical protein
MGNLGQRFQVDFFSEVEIDVIHHCIHTLLILFPGCLLGFHIFYRFVHDAKIRGKGIGDLSDVAINVVCRIFIGRKFVNNHCLFYLKRQNICTFAADYIV